MNVRSSQESVLSWLERNLSRAPDSRAVSRRLVHAALTAAHLALVAGVVNGQPRDEPPVGPVPRAPIELDRDQQELRIPCRFVNPSRVLEVFACHRNGPTHETVVEFDATGPELYQALLDLGCHPGAAWNITSPNDFLQTQGDRILIEVRWTYKGRARVYPAEGLLYDGEFGFPAFVRGFSFDARTPPGRGKEDGATEDVDVTGKVPGRSPTGEGPARIPVVVEVTLGGTARQSPSYSLLRHPTTSARLERWMLPPVVNPEVVEDLPVLVEQQTPAVLILRRLPSEKALITYLRSVAARRGVEDRLPIYDRLEPIAETIDVEKARLRALAARVESLIGRPAGSGGKNAEQVVKLLAEGRWLVERIEASYLAMYQIQEAFKLAWVERRDGIPARLVEEAKVLVNDGFQFEPRLAEKRVALARLDRDGAPPDSLARRRLTRELEILQKTRDSRLVAANLRYVRGRLEGLAKDDDYLRELFGSDVFRLETKLRLFTAERAVLQAEVEELRAREENRWADAKPAIQKQQNVARQEVVIARLEERLTEVLDELRWAKDDLESGIEARQRKAKKALAEFTLEKDSIRTEIAQANERLKKLRDG